MQRAGLNTIDMPFPRSIIMLTSEESSPWTSLMAGELPLGPSDAPCSGETSTAHGDLSFWVTALHTGKVTSDKKSDLVHAHSLLSPFEAITLSSKTSAICLSIYLKSSRSITSGVLHRISKACGFAPTKIFRSVLVSDSPEKSTHRISLTAGESTLGPSDALCPVMSSTAHGGTLIGLVVSLNGPLKPKSSPFPPLINLSPNSYGPLISSWPRFVYIKLWPILIFLRYRYSNVKGRRHFSVIVSTSLYWLSHSDSQTMVLFVSLAWLIFEEISATEGIFIVLVSSCLGLDYYCRIDSVFQCTIPVHTSSQLKEFQSSTDLTSQIRIQRLHLSCLMRDPEHLPIQKPFHTSSYMERTLLWNLHPWPPMSKVKICHCFLVLGSPVSVTPKAKVTSTTSQNLLIVTNNLYFADLFAKAFSTHHDLACGKVLCCFCLRVPMDLSLNVEAYSLWFSIVTLIYFALVVSNHEVEELVTFTLFWA